MLLSAFLKQPYRCESWRALLRSLSVSVGGTPWGAPRPFRGSPLAEQPKRARQSTGVCGRGSGSKSVSLTQPAADSSRSPLRKRSWKLRVASV